jgi:hypothetical protein
MELQGTNDAAELALKQSYNDGTIGSMVYFITCAFSLNESILQVRNEYGIVYLGIPIMNVV